MGVARMLRPWRAVIQEVFPRLHGHQVNALCEASFAMARAGHCGLARMAAATPGGALLPSRERRWQRLVANGRIDAAAAARGWASAVLAGAAAVTLGLDETPQREHLRAMKVGRLVGGRAIPVAWSCYRPGAAPLRQDALVLELLEGTHRALPPGARPTLLADRGLSWPAVLDFCVRRGWRYLLRVQGHTRAALGDGREVAMKDLAPRPGSGWCGPAWVFKKAGWRRANVVAWWEPRRKEPWLLITDLPADRRRCRQYRKRMRQEQSFRDEKSHGFHWGDSRVRDPEHAWRLLLVMALATAWLTRIGLWLVRSGRRGLLERRDRRTLSLFQLGLRYLQTLIRPPRLPPCFESVGR
jgi:hypothetical protein